MSEAKPLPRTYDDDEVRAFKRVSPLVWNQKYKDERGPAWFACGPYWAEELWRKSREAERDAIAFRTAAIALKREEPKRHPAQPTPQPEPTEERTNAGGSDE